MAKDKITEYDATANNNTVCGDVNIAENSALPSDMNNFAREIMSHLKEGLGSGTPLYVDQTNNRLGINTSSPASALDVSGDITFTGDLASSTSGTSNFVAGVNAGDAITSGGNYNTVVGDEAGTAITTGDNNVAVGFEALSANTTASDNTAVGYQALTANTTGQYNTAIGGKQSDGALGKNTSGSYNTAVGIDAMGNNTTAGENTAIGYQAMKANTTGVRNSGLGTTSLSANTTGTDNTAVGFLALQDNTTATDNTAVGTYAGRNITTGPDNTMVGKNAGATITDAASNTMIGESAGANTNSDKNTFVGRNAGSNITSGAKNTILGRFNGNENGLDMRTLSNHVILSDGDGNIKVRYEDDNRMIHKWGGTGNTSQFWNTSSDPYGIFLYFSANDPDNNTNYFLNCQGNGTDRLKIFSDGDVVNHDNSYGSLSDVKLKEQITDASSQWDDIKALTVRKYKMKSDVATGDSDAHWRLGLIAQEVETAGMNGLIKENPDLDAETNEDLGTTTKSIKYSVLYMKAVKALQEAMERIETLEQKVATLEGA